MMNMHSCTGGSCPLNYVYINAEVCYSTRGPTRYESTVARSLLCLAKPKVRNKYILPNSWIC